MSVNSSSEHWSRRNLIRLSSYWDLLIRDIGISVNSETSEQNLHLISTDHYRSDLGCFCPTGWFLSSSLVYHWSCSVKSLIMAGWRCGEQLSGSQWRTCHESTRYRSGTAEAVQAEDKGRALQWNLIDSESMSFQEHGWKRLRYSRLPRVNTSPR